ncbi:CD320 antigen [Vidua chalybeata]|uniref:CD320 antigen n=1 Tax=Vidua chalybeata TaxID=81927 RepID=UPI0023A7D72F|nr:CD320 antigen [Vidua chalybeata]
MSGPSPSRGPAPPRRAREVGGASSRARAPPPRAPHWWKSGWSARAFPERSAFVAARRPQRVPPVRSRGMAGPRMLPPGLPVLLLLPLALPLPAGDAAPSRCRPDQFQCAPGALCFPQDWRCDGHPDCEDGEDERGCGTATAAEPSPGGPAVTPPRSSAVPPAGSAEPSAMPEVSVPSRSQGHTWILIVAGLLIILVAASSVAAWGLSRTKPRSDTFGLEKASREQLMPGKCQTGSLP